jgi:hypothetical protein
MGFQILNTEGKSISINELDAEAASFWNKPVHPKRYANPIPQSEIDKSEGILKAQLETVTNWVDSIGWHINKPQIEWTSGWDNIKCSMWTLSVCDWGMVIMQPEFGDIASKIEGVKQYLKPYFDLIDYWKSKGYTPKQVED